MMEGRTCKIETQVQATTFSYTRQADDLHPQVKENHHEKFTAKAKQNKARKSAKKPEALRFLGKPS